MRALIVKSTGEIVQLEEKEFPVSKSLKWVPIDDDLPINIGWKYNSITKQWREPEPTIEKSYDLYEETIIQRLISARKLKEFDVLLNAESNLEFSMIWNARVFFNSDESYFDDLRELLETIPNLDVKVILAP